MPLAQNPVETMGQLFPDGGAIDQLRGGQLVSWDQDRRQTGMTVEYQGRSYAPATLDPGLEQMLHLPRGDEDFGSTDELVAGLQQEVALPGLDEDAMMLIAISSVATWVAECLPGHLLINFWGAGTACTTLIDLLTCLCRRALPLVDPSLYGLASLPAGLRPTLVLRSPSERNLKRLVAAAADPSTHFIRGGEIVRLHFPMIVCTPKPVTVPALRIPLLPATQPVRRITNSEAERLADFFQPRLLRYRMTQHRRVADSQFDVAGLCPEVRLVARVLGAAVDDSPRLQTRIIEALRSADEQYRAEQSQAPVAVVVEALTLLCHSNRSAPYVGEITDVVNSLLENCGEDLQLSSRQVGEILRQQLALIARRRSPGYELLLDSATRRRIHHLGIDFGVMQRVTDCPLCEEMVVTVTTENQAASGLKHVHDVHDVHQEPEGRTGPQGPVD